MPRTSERHRIPELWDGFRAGLIIDSGTAKLVSRQARSSRTGSLSLRGRAPKDSLSITFVAFDLLYHDGRDWTVSSLSDRRAELTSLITESDRIAISRVFADGRALLALAAAHGLEGVVAKDRRSVYEPGIRSRRWLKTKVPGAHLAHDWNGDAKADD